MPKKPTSAAPKRVSGRKRSTPTSEQSNKSQAPAITTADEASPEAVRDLRYIVGFGASAGGLDAITEVLRGLPAKTGLAYVIVQHLDPKHVSFLREILTRETPIPILEIENGMRITPDTAYVVAPDTVVTIRNGELHLAQRNPALGRQLVIDNFLRSLANDQGARAIGVILSGNASDGTLGTKAVKAAGGITIAQDPKSARNDQMPSSAIAYGYVDRILPPAGIAAELVDIANFHSPSASDGVDQGPPGSIEKLTRIINLLRNARGVDFSQYKTNTIRRRILRRMLLQRVRDPDEYVNRLRSDAAEVEALYEDLLINVTEFFRDPEVFQSLTTRVFPAICSEEKLGKDKQIRIWVPGCSTGEEVYSIAITLLEYLGERAAEIAIQLFATDISENALERARVGCYPNDIAQVVSPERLRGFFLKVESGFQIQKRVREMCIFAHHNVTKDPPFSKLDLISCRNLLIYLGKDLQEKLIPVFHYALNPGGYLVLGSTETIGAFNDLFLLVDKKHKIYERKPVTSRTSLDFLYHAEYMPDLPVKKDRSEHWSEIELQREADRMVLARYGPPGVVIDEEMNILQFRGHTSAFLEAASGVASLNLKKMAREGLLVEVKSALAVARQENSSVKRPGLRVRYNGGFLEFNLEVLPMRRGGARSRLYLVVFEPSGTVPAEARVAQQPKQGMTALERENEQLRTDLSSTRDYLQSVIEDQEAAQEELRSATEEIQSANEELQSTNEELETAKEELQSTNEELNTVNEELQNRNLQLTQLSNDLLNLLSSVSMPIVILGNDLRIRRFTPAAEKVLHLIPTDVGRPIRDIALSSQIPKLEEQLTEVVEQLTPRMMSVDDAGGRHFSLRLRPYRTEDNRIDGVVMVFVDFDRRVVETVPLPGSDESISTASQIRQFAARLLQAQEDERRRVARELHDDLNQKLALLEFTAASADRAPDLAPPVRDRLDLLRRSVAELTEDVRRIAYDLHPSILDDLGVVAGVRAYCEDFAKRESIEVNFSAKKVPGSISQDVGLVLYRIVQEGLRNALKHSGSKVVAVALTAKEGQLELSIRDLGLGFDVQHIRSHTGLGLIGMEERARLVGGTLTVRSTPGAGTEILVRVPLGPTGPETAHGSKKA